MGQLTQCNGDRIGGSEDSIFGGSTLLIDGDILVYRPCCIFIDDTARDHRLIQDNIDRQISKLCSAVGATNYEFFLTTKYNFRDYLVDDYKANRKELVKPVNIAFAKKYAISEHGATYVPYLEADDLLAMAQTEDTIIWSLDKDLRQVPGNHLDNDSLKEITIDAIGTTEKVGRKVHFTGYKGLLFQALTGDNADHIVGCGVRSGKLGKTGIKARKGIGAMKALKLLTDCKQDIDSFEEVVFSEYQDLFGDDWVVNLETQVNLLFMIKEGDNKDISKTKYIKQWTYDKRDSFMEIKTGKIVKEIQNATD